MAHIPSRVLQLITDEGFLPMWETIAWSAVENSVLFGELDVNTLTDHEVVREALILHLDGIELDSDNNSDNISKKENANKVQWSSNHEPRLKSQGDKFLDEGKWEFATLFYATWIEHWLNRIILLRAIGTGVPQELATELIRSSQIEHKMGRIWRGLEIPRFPRELTRQVTRVMECRNAFVHYKWPVEDDETSDKSLDRIKMEAQKARETVASLIEFEDLTFYNGRANSIREAFRKHWHERRQETLGEQETSIKAPHS